MLPFSFDTKAIIAQSSEIQKKLSNLYYGAQRINYPNERTLPEWIMDGEETAATLHDIRNYIYQLNAALYMVDHELNRKKTLKEKLKDLFK